MVFLVLLSSCLQLAVTSIPSVNYQEDRFFKTSWTPLSPMLADITRRARQTVAIELVEFLKDTTEGEIGKKDIDYEPCVNGSYVFGSSNASQLYYVNIALRASGLKCLKGDIILTGSQIEKETELVYLIGSLLIDCDNCVSANPFPHLLQILKQTDQTSPKIGFVNDAIYNNLYPGLAIKSLSDTSLTFPKLRAVTVDAKERLPSSSLGDGVYFVSLFFLDMQNVAISLPELETIAIQANIQEYFGDDFRGMVMRELTNVPVDMPLLKQVLLMDTAFDGVTYSANQATIAVFLAENDPCDYDFPSLEIISIYGAGAGSTTAVYVRSASQGTVSMDALTTIQLSAGVAITAEKFTPGKEGGISMASLETFAVDDQLKEGEYDVFMNNGLTQAYLGSSFTLNLPALTTSSCSVKNSGVCFTVLYENVDVGRDLDKSVYYANLPSLESIQGYVGGGNLVGCARCIAAAYGVVIYGNSAELDLRSLRDVSVVADKTHITIGVFSGPRSLLSGATFSNEIAQNGLEFGFRSEARY